MSKHQATIKEIAKALNVAISTVSRALKDDPRIGLRTKMRVKALSEQLHYVPNQAAKSLRSHDSYTIGVVLPQLQEEFFSQAIMGIEDAFDGKGYNISITQSRDKYDREVKAIQYFLNSRVDGVIVSISAETADYQHFLQMQHFGTPIVFFDRVPINFPSHQVRSNVEDGVEQAMAYLAGKGLKKIALLNGPQALGISQERLTGFEAAAQKFAIHIPADYIKYTNMSREDVGQKMEELCADPAERPEAIVAFNDYVALNAIKWCKQHGLRPNEDILFVSFANLPITDYLDHPPAASLEQYAYQMGENAALLLLQLLQNESAEEQYKTVLVDTKLVVNL